MGEWVRQPGGAGRQVGGAILGARSPDQQRLRPADGLIQRTQVGDATVRPGQSTVRPPRARTPVSRPLAQSGGRQAAGRSPVDHRPGHGTGSAVRSRPRWHRSCRRSGTGVGAEQVPVDAALLLAGDPARIVLLRYGSQNRARLRVAAGTSRSRACRAIRQASDQPVECGPRGAKTPPSRPAARPRPGRRH